MKKIAKTTSGTVIVEINQEQFEALEKIIGKSTVSKSTEFRKTLSKRDLVDYVSVRLNKLRPKKLPAVEKSISAMFNFNGGIEKSEIKEVIASMKKRKLLFVDEAGKVSYPNV